jgi:steroid delta-isomerase-like uncharacterized protein
VSAPDAAPAAVVRRYLDALNAGDAAAAVACVAEGFVNEHTSTRGTSVVGRAAYAERLPSFLARFRGLRYEVEDLIADGDRVAVAYTMRAAWPPDDAPVTVRGMFRFVVTSGAITHRTDYWDTAHLPT